VISRSYSRERKADINARRRESELVVFALVSMQSGRMTTLNRALVMRDRLEWLSVGARVGREGVEPSSLGLKARCSAD
jgi:hypothetical protein